MKLESSGGGAWFKFQNKGDKVSGEYAGYRANVEGKFGIENILTLTARDGRTVNVRCPAQLNRILTEHQSKLVSGAILTITYMDNIKTKNGGFMKSFDVDLTPPTEPVERRSSPNDKIPF